MFRVPTPRTSERGMTGIGVLILFIALVLVAAIAAGLILDTAGFLQNTAQDTGEQSTSEVSDRLSVLSASGEVVEAPDTTLRDEVDSPDLGIDYDFQVFAGERVYSAELVDLEVPTSGDDAELDVILEDGDNVEVERETFVVDDGDVLNTAVLFDEADELDAGEEYTVRFEDGGAAETVSEIDGDVNIFVQAGEVNAVEELSLTVYRSPGAGDVDLQHATIEYFSPEGTAFLIHEEEFEALSDEELEEDFADNLGTFTVEAVKDDDGSIPVLNSRDDRASMDIGLYANPNGQATDGEAAAMTYLYEGNSATMRITTQHGATTTEIVNVPESLAGYEGSTVLL